MKVKYTKDFEKSLKKIKDKIALKRLDILIEKLKQAQHLREVSNVKALSNYPGHYRIHIGYRLIVSYWTGEIIILLIEYLKKDENTYEKYI